MLCTGVEDSVGLQSEDCLAVDQELPAFHANCRGKSECKTYFSGLVGAPWTGECQETELTRTNEMRVLYRCGEIILGVSSQDSTHHPAFLQWSAITGRTTCSLRPAWTRRCCRTAGRTRRRSPPWQRRIKRIF